jgi:hypothetical protein
VFYNHKLRFWEEYFMQFNQLRVNYSYDKYINRWYYEKKENLEKEDEQKQHIQTFTNKQFMKREKKELNHHLKEKEFEILKLKICLKELIAKVGNDVNGVSDKTKEIMAQITNEEVCGYDMLEKEINEEEKLEHAPEKDYDLKDKEEEENETEGKKEEEDVNENKEDDMKGEEDEEHPEGDEGVTQSEIKEEQQQQGQTTITTEGEGVQSEEVQKQNEAQI